MFYLSYYQIATKSSAVVAFKFILVTCIGKNPIGTALKTTGDSPPTTFTDKSPDLPIYNTHPLLASSPSPGLAAKIV